MIHNKLWTVNQSYVGLSRTTKKSNIHILFWQDNFYKEKIKQLCMENEFKQAYETNKKILKDDEKFREMFTKVKSYGHNWCDRKSCDCQLCITRQQDEINNIQKLKCNDVIEFRSDGKLFLAKIMDIKRFDTRHLKSNF